MTISCSAEFKRDSSVSEKAGAIFGTYKHFEVSRLTVRKF